MIYDIRLAISYVYDRPAAGGRNLLRLLPADLPGVQRVIRSALTVRPEPIEQTRFTDFFGTEVVGVALPAGATRVEFEARARVERLAPAPVPDISAPLADLPDELFALRDLGRDAPHHFLGASPRIAPVEEITAFARAAVRGATGTAAAVRALGRAIHAAMRFDPQATTVDTPPLDAFRRREGVCQDFAQVMIAGLRGLGVPAAYVSGFLRTVPPPGRPRLEGADAMHAWVRAWCGRRIGWIDYDPTNACLAGEDHVVVGHGRDYGDVAPVTGVLRIAGGQTSRQAVDMVALPGTARPPRPPR